MDSTLAWVGVLFISAALLSVLYFVFEQERKKITGPRELALLDVLALEHQEGIADNREKLETLIRKTERSQTPSAELTTGLNRVRRILNSKPR